MELQQEMVATALGRLWERGMECPGARHVFPLLALPRKTVFKYNVERETHHAE